MANGIEKQCNDGEVDEMLKDREVEVDVGIDDLLGALKVDDMTQFCSLLDRLVGKALGSKDKELIHKHTSNVLERSLRLIHETQTYKQVEDAAARSTTIEGPCIKGVVYEFTEPLQFLAPRGKHYLHIAQAGICLINNKGFKVNVLYENIQHSIKISKKLSTKKDIDHYLLVLCLKDPVLLSRGSTEFIVLKLVADDMAQNLSIDVSALSDNQPKISGAVHSALENLLTITTHKALSYTLPEAKRNESVFISTASESFVKCYWKTSDGFLYLLSDGLFFMNPFKFIPRSSIESIQCGRGGAASARTFDLILAIKGGGSIEFTMIEREELAAVTAFVRYLDEMRLKDQMPSDKEFNEGENMSEVIDNKQIQIAPVMSEPSDNANEDSEDDDESFCLGSDASDKSYDSDPLSGDAISESEECFSEDASSDAEDGNEEDDCSEDRDEDDVTVEDVALLKKRLADEVTESDSSTNEEPSSRQRMASFTNAKESRKEGQLFPSAAASSSSHASSSHQRNLHGFFVKRQKTGD